MSDSISYRYELKAWEGAVTLELQCSASYEPPDPGCGVSGGWFFEWADVDNVRIAGGVWVWGTNPPMFVLTRNDIERHFGGLLLDALDQEAGLAAEAKREEYQEVEA